MIYGYIRVSTDRQNTANQRHEIEKFAAFSSLQIDRWVEETVSSRKGLQERRLGRLLGRLQKGDILIATELSRLGRNMLKYADCGICDAVRMMTATPAAIMKINDRGTLTEGKIADICVFDDNVNITDVYLKGQKVCL